MSDLEKKMELVDKAFEGKLHATDKVDYQEKLDNDPDFAALVRDMTLMREALRHKALKENFAALKDLEKTLPPVELSEKTDEHLPTEYNHPGILKRINGWAAAASVLLLLATGTYLFTTINKTDADQIYEQHFQPYPNLETERSLLQSGPDRLAHNNPEKSAYAFYDAKNYEAAIPAFQLLLQLKNDPKDYFFLGNAYLANGNITEAIDTFRKLLELPSDFKDRANWYLALAYLKNDNSDLAQSTLKDLSKNAQALSYKEKAAQLLKELN
jgi:tetratricopeptide (TPR) repeat protein